MLTSHIATLAYYVRPYAARYADPAYEPVVDDIVYKLGKAVSLLEDKPVPPQRTAGKEIMRILSERVNARESQPVADRFAGKGKIERHRMVYALLKEEFASGVHALALQTLAPGET